MCEPTTIAAATFALSAASAGAGYVAQSGAASNSNAFQKNRYRSVAEAAQNNYQTTTNDLITRSAQEVAAASGQAISVDRDSTAAKGRARASLGASGVSGTTANELLDQFDAINSLNQTSIRTNLGWSQAQIERSIAGLRADAQGQIINATPQLQSGPSPLALGLQLGSSALGSLGTYYDMKRQMPATKGG